MPTLYIISRHSWFYFVLSISGAGDVAQGFRPEASSAIISSNIGTKTRPYRGYGLPERIANARYNCSASIARASSCEYVIALNDIF